MITILWYLRSKRSQDVAEMLLVHEDKDFKRGFDESADCDKLLASFYKTRKKK